MTNYLITRTATAQTIITNNIGTVYNHIDSNPATTRAEMVVALALNLDIVNYLLDKVLLPSQVIVNRHSVSGAEHLWTGGDWATALIANIDPARTWLTTNDNNTTAQMASEMGIHEAVAVALAHALMWELKAQLTPL